MGGRGASSGRAGGGKTLQGVSFTNLQGKTTTWYFQSNGKTNFYKTGIGDVPKPTPNNMTPKEMISRLKNTAKDVKIINKSQYDKAVKEHKAYRKEMDAMLNNADLSNSTRVKSARAFRKGNRASRRK